MKFVLALFMLYAVSACAPARRASLPIASLQSPVSSLSPLPTPTKPLPTVAIPATGERIQSATLDHLPKISHDLVFVNDFALKRWDHLSGQIEVLAGPEKSSELQPYIVPISFSTGPGLPLGGVGEFSISADGQKIAFVRRGQPNVPYFEVALLDMANRQITTLVHKIDTGEILLSPNGQWLAYVASENSIANDVPSGIYVVQTSNPSQRLKAGSCPCPWFSWSPDSRTILWKDKAGIWLAEPGQSAQLVVTDTIVTLNGEVGRALHPRSLSPSGRYILVGISAPIEGGSYGIADTQTGHVTELKDSFEYVEPIIELGWLQDDRLMVIRDSTSFNSTPPTAEIWHVDPTQDSMLILDAEFALGLESSATATALTQLADGRVVFAAVDTSEANPTAQGLYTLDLQAHAAHKMNDLPDGLFDSEHNIYVIQVFWSPDGTEAIVSNIPSLITHVVYYVPLNGGTILDLGVALGNNADGFTWIK